MNRARAACALLLGLAACRGSEPPAAPTAALSPTPAGPPPVGFLDESREGSPAEGGVLRRRLNGEPTTLNAVLQSSGPEAQVLQYVVRNLFDFDARLHLVPGLAEAYEISEDGLTCTIRLRPDAVWEDGRPITSADAVFTIRKIADPAVPAPVWKPLFEDMESVEALDARRFRVKFREPYAYRAMAFALPILPEHRFRGRAFLSAADNRAPLASGPYRVVSWKAQESVTLARNPRWWGPAAHVDRIEFRIVPDNTTAYRLLTAGELDEDQLDASLTARAATDPAFRACCRAVEFYNLDWNYVALNNRSPFFADPRVRRALTMLSDRGSIVRNLYRGSARIISGPWAPDSPAYDANVPPVPFDRRGAARLLEESGWRDSNGNGTLDREGREFEFEILAPAGSDISRQIDEMLSSELARVGVTAHVRTMEWAAFVARVDGGEFEAASLGWSAVDPNPDPYFYWHSSQCAPKGLNSVCYQNPEADRLMEQARGESDAEARTALLHRLHRIFRDDAPVLFLVNSTQKFGFSKAVRGLTTSPLGLYGIWPGPVGWWLAPPAAVRPAA